MSCYSRRRVSALGAVPTIYSMRLVLCKSCSEFCLPPLEAGILFALVSTAAAWGATNRSRVFSPLRVKIGAETVIDPKTAYQVQGRGRWL